MKRTWCGLGVILLLLAAASALAGSAMLAEGTRGGFSLGSLWYQMHGNSLVGFQALIEKGVSPAVWPPIQSLLTWPLWLVLGIPGGLAALCCLRLRQPGRATG